MSLIRSFTLLLGTLLLAGLTACGTSSSGEASAATPLPATTPITLTGNWQLSGSRVPPVYPLLSTAFTVSGNQISGASSIGFQCTPTSTYDFNGFPFTGTIAQDGTFQAMGQFGSLPTVGNLQVTITGSSPPASAPNAWSGTYQINFTSATTPACTYNQTVGFNAQPIPLVNGTYTGSATSISGSGPFGTSATLTLQLTQGTPVLTTNSLYSYYQIPLTASLVITGSTCATSATTQGVTSLSRIYGDELYVNMILSDGSTVIINGNLNNPAASQIAIHYMVSGQGSKCSTGLFGETTLTRK